MQEGQLEGLGKNMRLLAVSQTRSGFVQHYPKTRVNFVTWRSRSTGRADAFRWCHIPAASGPSSRFILSPRAHRGCCRLFTIERWYRMTVPGLSSPHRRGICQPGPSCTRLALRNQQRQRVLPCDCSPSTPVNCLKLPKRWMAPLMSKIEADRVGC